jgi:hypothetical protein
MVVAVWMMSTDQLLEHGGMKSAQQPDVFVHSALAVRFHEQQLFTVAPFPASPSN